jgi:hypothetical protein
MGRLDGLTHFGHLIPLKFTLKYTDMKNNIHGLNSHIGERGFSCWLYDSKPVTSEFIFYRVFI